MEKKSRNHKIDQLGFLIFSNVLVINLGVSVLIGFTEVSKFLGGPFILKLTPKTPSPVFFPTKILPNKGIDPIVLLMSCWN